MSSKTPFLLTGLVAATHTPFGTDGALNLSVVERQAAHLLANGVTTVFIGGTTGESASLSLAERLELAAEWMKIARGTKMRVVVHVGGNCLVDSRTLAAQAQQLGAAAISAVAPSYFKAPHVDLLVDSMADIATAAPDLPFYYYEIPTMTGVAIPPSDFLARAAERIPNLAGLKFTSTNLMEYQVCRAVHDGRFDLPFGCDEMLLAALALGARGAVGSTYNFAAPLYHRLLAAFSAGDLETARREQARSVRLVRLLAGRGFMGAAKAVMQLLGVDVGPARLPNASLNPDQQASLADELESLGFFDWLPQ
jgi:N-acetylneuraminate lyase